MRILISILFFLLILPSSVSAHMIGQPPFFKINGAFTDYYPVPSSSFPEFNLPQDLAHENYLVNQELSFDVDLTALPIPPDLVKTTTFVMDFGDGEKVTGVTAKHKYSKPGTYFMNINVTTPEVTEPQLLQSTAINILPSSSYQLPKSVVKINNKTSKDPLVDILEVDFGKNIKFDGSDSNGGSSKITEYFWDLGDGSSKNDKSFDYKYKENPYITFPALRIKTEDGFIIDSYVQLTDSKGKSESGNNTTVSDSMDFKTIAISALLALFLTGIIFFIFRKFTSKPRR